MCAEIHRARQLEKNAGKVLREREILDSFRAPPAFDFLIIFVQPSADAEKGTHPRGVKLCS